MIRIDIFEGPGGFYVEIDNEKLRDDAGNIRWFTRRCVASRVARRKVIGKLFRLVHWYAF